MKEIVEIIKDSKIVAYAKNIGRKLAEVEKIKYDDPKDIWLSDKAKELAIEISKHYIRKEEVTKAKVKDIEGFPEKSCNICDDKLWFKCERGLANECIYWEDCTLKEVNATINQIGELEVNIRKDRLVLDEGETEKAIIKFFNPILPVPFNIRDLAKAIAKHPERIVK